MLHLGLAIVNPWSKRFSTVKVFAGDTVFEDYFWEVEILRTNDVIGLGLGIVFGVKDQHNNVHISLALLGYSASFMFYNRNHC